MAFCVIVPRMESKRYFTGKPCANGHVAERLKSNRTCIECLNIKKKKRGSIPEVRSSDLKRLMNWNKKNPHRHLARTRKRQAAKLQRTPNWLSTFQLKQMADTYAIAAKLTGITGELYHVDHIVPLQGKKVSGLHVPWNLQVIPAKDNLAKSNKH